MQRCRIRLLPWIRSAGELYKFEGDTYDAKPEALAFGRKWYKVAERLWAEGKWAIHPQRVGAGSLVGLLDGLQEMREGMVSGQKLVYYVDETAWPDKI